MCSRSIGALASAGTPQKNAQCTVLSIGLDNARKASRTLRWSRSAGAVNAGIYSFKYCPRYVFGVLFGFMAHFKF